MNHHYKDIRNRIPEPPKWFDEQAVPRYDKFAPNQTADIYCDEVALVEIACQSCGTHFLVAISSQRTDYVLRLMERDEYKSLPSKEAQNAWFEGLSKSPLADGIREKGIGYGDPPNVECCPSGPTMTSDAIRVCEYWHQERMDWVRDAALEIPLDTIYSIYSED